MILEWIWHPFWIDVYVFSIPSSSTCSDWLVLGLSIEFGTLNSQNAGYHLSKIDNCLKLPFPTKIIKRWFLVPFWHRFIITFHDFREFVRYLFFIDVGFISAPLRYTLASFSNPCCSTLSLSFRKGCFGSCLFHSGILLAPFWDPFATPLALIWFPSGFLWVPLVSFFLSFAARYESVMHFRIL